MPRIDSSTRHETRTRVSFSAMEVRAILAAAALEVKKTQRVPVSHDRSALAAELPPGVTAELVIMQESEGSPAYARWRADIDIVEDHRHVAAESRT